MEISYVIIENTYHLEKSEIVVVFLKNETDDDEYLFNIYDKTNKPTNHTRDNLCNKIQETTNVTGTHSGRIVKRPSRYDCMR